MPSLALESVASFEPTTISRSPTGPEAQDRIGENVLRLLSLQRSNRRGSTERRREQRHAYPYPVYLTPVGRDGLTPVGKTVVVIGKHLCEKGFDFYCRDALPFRRAVATFEGEKGNRTSFLMDLTWCRFGRHGWYDNGGKFLTLLGTPESIGLSGEFESL